MLTKIWLKQTCDKLTKAGIGTARLDALVLLEDCLNKNRTHLLAHLEIKLSPEQILWLNKRVSRRIRHEPLAYIRGKTEFYGYELAVNGDVLEPRPESETIIDLLKALVHRNPPLSHTIIVDVGTGSGALAITTRLEFPHLKVLATDIDEKCLVVARKNASALGAQVKFFEGDLLAPIPLAVFPSNYIVLANLPYVPNNFTINPAAMNEPRIAIFGGSDGLDVYRKLFLQIDKLKSKPLAILAESLPPQHDKLTEIARTNGYRLTKTDDFIQQFELA